MQVLKTLIADDHLIFVEGLKCLLRKLDFRQLNIVAVANDGKQAIEKIRSHQPELVFLDMNMPALDGLGVLKSAKSMGYKGKIIVLSMYENPKIVRAAFKAGADAYLLKSQDPRELTSALEAVLAGQSYVGQGVYLSHAAPKPASDDAQMPYRASDQFLNQQLLTKRELEVLQLVTEALSNKEIAKELYISDQTVSVHRKNIMRKLGVSNTAGLIKVAHDNALV